MAERTVLRALLYVIAATATLPILLAIFHPDHDLRDCGEAFHAALLSVVGLAVSSTGSGPAVRP